MRIGCLCVTERRPHLLGIALASYHDQTHGDKCLYVIYPEDGEDVEDGGEEAAGYAQVRERLQPAATTWTASPLRSIETVCARLDQGCAYLFDEQGCDVVATWDDDDWKHPSYLAAVAAQLEVNPQWLITGYLWGCYVNARHLWAEDLSKRPEVIPWGYWGASLVYRKEAWRRQAFTELPFLGYDPAFCRSVGEKYWAPPVDDDPYKMLSFCHGQNCYQHCRGGGIDLKPWLEANVSTLAQQEIWRVREWFIEHGVEPPQINRPY